MHIINTLVFLVNFYNLVDMCLALYKFSLFLCGGTLKVFYMNKTIFSYCLQTTQIKGCVIFGKQDLGFTFPCTLLFHVSILTAITKSNIYVIVY
jgi:hypothetical protein